ncbi:MAG: prolyl oligopeptidase family serine peptidase, partial [Sulfuricaulis sp.]|nr:prolyl oligopeptidase family serine peptidase [Sulfuricaulis sp.]
YWDRWLDDRKAHLFVQESKAGAKPRDLLAGARLVALPGFGGRPGESGEDLPAAWTPDGRAIVFAASTTRNRAAYASVPVQLFEVSADGGEPHVLTNDADSYGEPEFRPDGKALLVTVSKGSSGYSEEFGQAIQRDPLKGPADEINQAADEAIKRYAFIDASRQAAGGASYGGHLANWLQATTTRYKCLISHAGLVNLETQWATSDVVYSRELSNGGPVWEQGPVWREQNPVRLAGNYAKKTGWVTPVLVTVGEQDFRVPANNTYEYWSYLQRLQVPSRLISFPDENHWILKGENSRFWFGEVHGWLAKWLK